MTDTPGEGQSGDRTGHEQPNAGTPQSDAVGSKAPPGNYGYHPGYGYYPGHGVPPGYGYPPPGYGSRMGGSDDRMWAMFSHLGIFVGSFFLGPLAFIAPMTIYLIKRDESPFIRHHGAQAFNIALSVLIVTTAGLILGLISGVFTFGIGFVIALLLVLAYSIAAIVFIILASVAANRGEWYRYPSILAFPMIK